MVPLVLPVVDTIYELSVVIMGHVPAKEIGGTCNMQCHNTAPLVSLRWQSLGKPRLGPGQTLHGLPAAELGCLELQECTLREFCICPCLVCNSACFVKELCNHHQRSKACIFDFITHYVHAMWHRRARHMQAWYLMLRSKTHHSTWYSIPNQIFTRMILTY